MRIKVVIGFFVVLALFASFAAMKMGVHSEEDRSAAPPAVAIVPESVSSSTQPSEPVANAPALNNSSLPSPASGEQALAPTANPPARASAPVTVIALSGAVILRQDGGTMTYQKKCERCGALSPGLTTGAAPSRGSTHNSGFNCQKCRHSQKVAITAR